jgi:hypothetical protein
VLLPAGLILMPHTLWAEAINIPCEKVNCVLTIFAVLGIFSVVNMISSLVNMNHKRKSVRRANIICSLPLLALCAFAFLLHFEIGIIALCLVGMQGLIIYGSAVHSVD